MTMQLKQSTRNPKIMLLDEVDGDVADGESEYIVLDEVMCDWSATHFRPVFAEKSFEV